MQRVATDDYIKSGLRRQTVRMTSGTVEAFAGHVPLELLSRFHATGCTRERPLRQAAPCQLKCVLSVTPLVLPPRSSLLSPCTSWWFAKCDSHWEGRPRWPAQTSRSCRIASRRAPWCAPPAGEVKFMMEDMVNDLFLATSAVEALWSMKWNHTMHLFLSLYYFNAVTLICLFSPSVILMNNTWMYQCKCNS